RSDPDRRYPQLTARRTFRIPSSNYNDSVGGIILRGKEDDSDATFLETRSGRGDRRLRAPDLLAGLVPARRAGRRLLVAAALAGGVRLRPAARIRARIDGPTIRHRDGGYHALPDRRRGPIATAPARTRRRVVDCPGRSGGEFRHRRGADGPRV